MVVSLPSKWILLYPKNRCWHDTAIFMSHEMPRDYEQKFEDFIRLCAEAKFKRIGHVIIARPSEIGDTYEEVMESLSRLADAGLALHIAGR